MADSIGRRRGHLIRDFGDGWVYADAGTHDPWDRPCVLCHEVPASDPTGPSRDACLGVLADTTSACCGHGVEVGYRVSSSGELHLLGWATCVARDEDGALIGPMWSSDCGDCGGPIGEGADPRHLNCYLARCLSEVGPNG